LPCGIKIRIIKKRLKVRGVMFSGVRHGACSLDVSTEVGTFVAVLIQVGDRVKIEGLLPALMALIDTERIWDDRFDGIVEVGRFACGVACIADRTQDSSV
jgi:hypothetical protein